jgi:hypothetical protein
MTMEFARRNFTGSFYNLSYRLPISDPLGPGASVRQGELTGNIGLTSSLPEKSQPDEKQRQNFDDRLWRLQIEFQCDSFPLVKCLPSHDRHVV